MTEALAGSNPWLSVSADNLDEANDCFQRKKYGYALFWLQQANETLAKGLLEYLRLMDSGRSESWITTLRQLGLDFQLPEAREYGHLYGEKFFSAMEKSLARFESDLPKAFESPKLAALDDRRADILKGYERQFKDWPKRIGRARDAYHSLGTPTSLSKTIQSCDKLLSLIANMSNMEPRLSDLPEEFAGSTLLVEAVDDLAGRFGIKMEPSLTTIYLRLLTVLMVFFVVLIFGRGLAPFEASVRYPEGHFQEHSRDLIIKNFNEIVALHKRCLGIAHAVVDQPLPK